MRLIFVYNAKSGLGNAILDSVHKVLSPSTYPCQLCAVTHGLARMRREWKAYVERLRESFEVTFLHLDELPQTLPKADYPCVFLHNGTDYEIILTALELQQCRTSSHLIDLIDEKIRT